MTERIWRANPGAQTDFLASAAYEVLYGGAAGGGKSDGLLMGGLRFVDHPEYSALYLRRTYPELERSVIPRSLSWFPSLGAKYNDSKHVWRFPSGARYYLGHIEHDSDVHEYQSSEFQYIAFDELTTFTEWQYRYMRSRARSAHGIPIRIRAGTNPGGDGHDWVQRYWAPWLGVPPGEVWTGPVGEPSKPLWYVADEQLGERWLREREAAALLRHWNSLPALERIHAPYPLGRCFIPAKVEDNPHLYEADPAYVARLRGLDQVTRAQLLHGNWSIRPAAGLYFKRSWFEFATTKPTGGRWVRYWDLAGTEPSETNPDPDWTVGGLLHFDDERKKLTICDVVRRRENPGQVLKTIKATAELDGTQVPIAIGQDPGQAGKFEVYSYTTELQGFDVQGLPETGDKTTRAGPVSAQCEAGNVRMVRGEWNEAFVQVLEGFPDGKHDDDVDMLSGGYAALTGNVPASYRGADPKRIVKRWSRR